MNDTEALLAELRDIHLPPEPSWWPPAPGWWVMAVVLLAGFGFALARFLAWRRRRRPRVRALRELAALSRAHADGAEATATVAALSVLMRRAALACAPREEVAGLTGVRWLEFLDSRAPEPAFTEGAGRALADAPYQPAPQVDLPALIARCRAWVGHNL